MVTPLLLGAAPCCLRADRSEATLFAACPSLLPRPTPTWQLPRRCIPASSPPPSTLLLLPACTASSSTLPPQLVSASINQTLYTRQVTLASEEVRRACMQRQKWRAEQTGEERMKGEGGQRCGSAALKRGYGTWVWWHTGVSDRDGGGTDGMLRMWHGMCSASCHPRRHHLDLKPWCAAQQTAGLRRGGEWRQVRRQQCHSAQSECLERTALADL